MTKITVSKNGLKSMGLKVNMGKTKVIISVRDLHTLQTSGKYPCAVCRKDVGKNSILCSGYSCWVHKKCSDIPGGLAKDPDFRCRCLGNAWAIDRRPCVEVQLADEKLDVVNSFVYFGDCICPSRGSELATIKGCRSAQGEFEEILPLLTCEAISLNTRGQMCNSCIRGSMLYLSECWAPVRQEGKKRLERSERAMLLWLCNIKKERVIKNSRKSIETEKPRFCVRVY